MRGDIAIYPMGVSARDIGSGLEGTVADSYPEARHYHRERHEFEQKVRDYLSTEGQHLYRYLGKHRPESLKALKELGIEGIIATEMPDGVVAALMKRLDNGRSVLISNSSNSGFGGKVAMFAQEYQIGITDARDYVITEELMHAIQPRSLQGIDAEIDVSKRLKRYFATRAAEFKPGSDDYNRYLHLTAVAQQRQLMLQKQKQGKIVVAPPVYSC